MLKHSYWLAGVALIIIGISAVLLLNNIREIPVAAAENALCEPTLADAGGVDISSAFRFNFAGVVSANAVRRFLSVEPAIELNFHQGLQAKEVLTVPMEPLQPGQIYRFSLQTEAETLHWAFQTKGEWRVEATVPACADTAVPPDSSLELYLNQSLSIDLARLADYFQIEPQIPGRFEQDGNCLRFIPTEALEPLTVYTVTLSAGLPALNSTLTLAEEYSFAFETANADGSAPQALWHVSAFSTFAPEQAPVFSCNFFDWEDAAVQEPDDSLMVDFIINAIEESIEGSKAKPIDNSIKEAIESFIDDTLDDALDDAPDAVEGTGPVLNAALYRYPDAQAYADDILSTHRRAPSWSYMGSNPQGADTFTLTHLFVDELPAQAANGYYSVSWPFTLPPGYYLLQASYHGQSRDIRFQISPLSAFLQTSLEESLFWVHGADGGPAASCLVTHVNSGTTGQTDEDGLLRLGLAHGLIRLDASDQQLAKDDVYLLRYGADELVLVDYINFNGRQASASADIWQYTVLSRDICKSGDTLEFWGYMRRRDNMDWEWSRVSVFICAKEQPDEPVWQGYAPLSGNIFQGSLQLPRLLPGPYELQIWQSGQMLISKGFTMEAEPNYPGNLTLEHDFRLTGDKDAYAIEEEYLLSLSGAKGDVLFIKSGNGIREAVVERQAQYRNAFAPEDLGGAYWQAVVFEGGRYQSTPHYNLLPQSRSLFVEASVRESSVHFTLRDAAGNAPAKASLLALIAPPGRPAEDAAAALYAPNRVSGLLDGANLPESEPYSADTPAAWAGEAICFAALELGKNSRAELELPEALPPGEWQLYAWAVADEPLPLAGSLQLPLATVPADKQAAPLEAAETNWLFISSSARVQAMELLCEARIDADDQLKRSNYHTKQSDEHIIQLDDNVMQSIWSDGRIKQYWAAFYAKHVFVGLCPGNLPPAIYDPPFGWADYQQPDGGLSPQPGAPADLLLSLLAASLEGQGAEICDKAALSRYLKGQEVIASSLTDRAMALSGLAALEQPVLQEIKLMLARENLPPTARACLIWGLAQAGDIQVAKAAFRKLQNVFASDANPDALYLEGGDGDNDRLNSLGALAAAACGESQAAYALLQHLQASDPLITALTAGALLRQCYATPASASISLSYIYRQAEIKGFGDFWLELLVPGPVTLKDVSGDIDYLIIK